MRKLFIAVTVAVFSFNAAAQVTSYSNPLYQGEDPWAIYRNGYYYVCTSGPVNPTAVYVSKSRTLLDRGPKIKVWEDADNYHRVFAPELHYINGKWYIYLCADASSRSWAHHAVVLEGSTGDPQDGFINRGILFTGDVNGNFQANDFTVLTYNSQLYAFWGSLNDAYVNGVVMAPMASPTSITAYRREIGLMAEGPRAIIRNNKIIMTGAAGAFASKSYCIIAVLYNGTGSIQDRANWTSLGTLFSTTTDVWGPSRASYTVSADSTEYWMMYHSKIFNADDNGMRQVNIKKFTFKTDDTPDFGTPPGPSAVVAKPSGDPGTGTVYQAESAALTGGAAANSSRSNYTGSGYVDGFTAAGASATFTVQAPDSGNYWVTLRYANGVVVAGEQSSFPTVYPAGKGSLSIYVNGVKAGTTYLDRTTNWNVWMMQGELLTLRAGSNQLAYRFDAGNVGQVALDYIAASKSDAEIHGLVASYFDNNNLTNLKLTRIDPNIAFDWGAGSPDPSIGPDSFSVRWTGFIEPLYTGTYTFYSKSDNGRRVWINNQLIIDKWLGDWDSTYTGTIALQAMVRYPIKVEYFENYGGANTRLEWSSASQLREVVPTGRLYPYEENVTATGRSAGKKIADNTPAFKCLNGNDFVTISFSIPEAGYGEITLMSVTGKCIATFGAACAKGWNSIKIGKEKIARGSYIIALKMRKQCLANSMIMVQ